MATKVIIAKEIGYYEAKGLFGKVFDESLEKINYNSNWESHYTEYLVYNSESGLIISYDFEQEKLFVCQEITKEQAKEIYGEEFDYEFDNFTWDPYEEVGAMVITGSGLSLVRIEA